MVVGDPILIGFARALIKDVLSKLISDTYQNSLDYLLEIVIQKIIQTRTSSISKDKQITLELVEASYKTAQKALKRTGISVNISRKDLEIFIARLDKLKDNDETNWNGYIPDHPLVVSLQKGIVDLLLRQNVEQEKINSFIVEYRTNIENVLEEYPHVRELFERWAKNETEKMLQEHLETMILLAEFKMQSDDKALHEYFVMPHGQFVEAEFWRSEYEENDGINLEALIEEYFLQEKFKNPRKPVFYPILLIGADFGIGKSTFLKIYASNLAKKFLTSREGYIPVYLMFRDLSNVNELKDQLEGFYENFISKYNRPVVFILDGLDESGEISKEHFSEILDFLKAFSRNKKNIRILISSRLVLYEYMHEFLRSNLGGIYLRIYRFNKQQVNEWFRKFNLEDKLNYDVLYQYGLREDEIGKPLFSGC